MNQNAQVAGLNTAPIKFHDALDMLRYNTDEISRLRRQYL